MNVNLSLDIYKSLLFDPLEHIILKGESVDDLLDQLYDLTLDEDFRIKLRNKEANLENAS